MLVAYELGKTVDEISHLSGQELVEWLAFFQLRQKRLDKEYERQRKLSKNRR